MIKSIQQLQEQVSGEVLNREHPRYDQVRRGWDLSIDHHPALILIPDNVEDIAARVRFAHASGILWLQRYV